MEAALGHAAVAVCYGHATGALRAHFFAASFGLDTASGGSARRCPSVCDRFLDAGTHSRQLHAAQGLDLENRDKLRCSSSRLDHTKPAIRFCADASDGSTRFAMSGVRRGVFLPCPPDAYAEPPGWLVWSLRSGRMAARVVYGLDKRHGAQGSRRGKVERAGPHSRRDLIQQSYSTLRQIQRRKPLRRGTNNPEIAAADRCCITLSARR